MESERERGRQRERSTEIETDSKTGKNWKTETGRVRQTGRGAKIAVIDRKTDTNTGGHIDIHTDTKIIQATHRQADMDDMK